VTPFIAVAALGFELVGAVALVVANLAAVKAWTRSAALGAVARKMTGLTTVSDIIQVVRMPGLTLIALVAFNSFSGTRLGAWTQVVSNLGMCGWTIMSRLTLLGNMSIFPA
jgi:hypothetical protein